MLAKITQQDDDKREKLQWLEALLWTPGLCYGRQQGLTNTVRLLLVRVTCFGSMPDIA